ncbi:hypothetical protein FQR65_LT02801 [Abscondita terminalis]|nr:hypothetical protein FQR65_LT02801 [Abscondita terminalis]
MMSSTEKIITIEKMEGDNKKRFPKGFKMVTIFFAEFLGTATLLFIGCMAGCTSRFVTDIPVLPHIGAAGFGLSVLLAIQLTSHISGAHLNPQVSLAALIMGEISFIMFPIYLVAEFLGALAGFGLLTVLWPSGSHPECSTMIHSDVTLVQALGLETAITSLLILSCCAVWDVRNKTNSDSVAIRLGLVISIICLGAAPITGASMNSARSFAPALFRNNWKDHWVYWCGPTVGSVIGSVFYKYILSYQSKED